MRELLTLCGYEPQELEAESARVGRAFEMVGITEEDVVQAKERINTYFDLELAGVRKILGVILRDFTNIVLLREQPDVKVAFSFMAPGCQQLGSALMANFENVAWVNPNYTFMIVLGSMFGKLVPVYEASERLWLRSGGVAHCGMVKCGLGLLAADMVPKPVLAVTSGFLCETSSKTVGLIEDWYGIPGYYFDCWQDRELREYPYAKRSTSYYAKSLRRLSENVAEKLGVSVSDAMLWKTLNALKSYAAAKARVQELMRHSDPIPMRSVHISLLYALDEISFREEELARTIEALDTLHSELLERTRRGVGATPKGAPRVLGVLPCHHADPRWEHHANEAGLAIVAADFEFSSSQGVDGAGVLDPDDPYDVMGQHMHSAAQQILGGRIEIILDVCRRLHLDGVVNHYHVGCRYVAGDAITIKNVVTKELGIPVLTFEWDNFDPRSYNHEQYKANLETFLGMMASGGGAAGGAARAATGAGATGAADAAADPPH
ncbi:MAG: 2-hydroxyacyl-CoA dehydratase [Thermoleophilia bacterium]|nr:2-hydroxyacyl-CoA dehydratase [Thermoleophilia bacterium]